MDEFLFPGFVDDLFPVEDDYLDDEEGEDDQFVYRCDYCDQSVADPYEMHGMLLCEWCAGYVAEEPLF